VWQSSICGGFKPEWGLLKVPKMWGVSVPPESPPMKLGGGKVGRNDVHKLHTSYGQSERHLELKSADNHGDNNLIVGDES